MGLFGFTNKKSTPIKQREKTAITSSEATAYQNGGNLPTDNRNFQAYINASSRLDTLIRTSASVASSARFQYGKVDTKGNFKTVTFKQSDGLYMNDYQTESDFIFELFGTLLTYDKVLLIPEQSKYPFRKGMIDWSIVPDDQFSANLGTNQSIETFTHRSSTGIETIYKYSEVVYITRNLTANNLIYAIPKIKALMKTIENILGIHNFMGEYIASGGKSSIIASSDSLLSEEQGRAVKKSLQDFLGSNAPKALLINSEKFTLDKVSDSLTTAGVLDIMTKLSDEISKSFNMPLYILGEYSSSTQGTTMQMANRTWFQIQLRPLFTTLSSAFTRYYRDFGGVKNVSVRFDFSEIDLLEDSDTDKLKIANDSLKSGIRSLNEARVYMGLPPLETESADLHISPAFLTGQSPVSFENFEADIARNLASSGANTSTGTGTNPSDGVESGIGGADNSEGMNGRA